MIFDRIDGRHLGAEACSRPDELAPFALAAIERCLRTSNDPALAVLPQRTYHVTVCDGVNPDVAVRATRNGHCLLRIDRTAPVRLRSALRELAAAGDTAIDFAPVGVEVRNTAVVMALQPTASSRSPLDQITRCRRTVLAELGRILGTDLMTPWRPHLTIAYRRWSVPLKSRTLRCVEKVLAGLSSPLRVEGVGLYEFDSMVTFRRRELEESGS